ncbi:hypothetical protein RJT34_13233 [Clitoria ternatea]|uniref:DUF659 domain-containing protein n=1 Tax=Clitoria ternatea TaxID=43366 RepID=A0AAN9PL90_CLITE
MSQNVDVLSPDDNAQGIPNPSASKNQSSEGSCCGKSDPAWKHVAYTRQGKTSTYTCLYYASSFRGGGINRMKQHLAGVTGQISFCKKVSHDVRYQIQQLLKNIKEKKKYDDLDEAYDDPTNDTERISFIKSVDASDVVKDAQTLCDMFAEVIEWVGPANVVHIVTDNTANYVAAGRLIHEKYETIF